MQVTKQNPGEKPWQKEKAMNICLFCANYLPNIGGIERYVYNTSKQLIKKGHKVTVVTSNVFDLASFEISEEGIEIYRLPCHNVMKGRYPILKKNDEFKKLDKKLFESDFDLIVINARFYIHSVYAARLARRKGVRCITIEHGSSHLSVNNSILDFFGGIYEHALTAVLKRYCKEYYAVSGAAGEWSGHFGIKSKGTLYNAVDVEQIEEIANKKLCDYRKELGIPENAVVITYTGRLLKEKGLYQLVEAVKNINNPNVYVCLAGDGPEMQGLSERANDNIKLLGKLDFEQVITLLDTSDIFCLPSVSEGMSTSVLEAIATKTFVITTYNGGARELITSDEYGIITMGNTTSEVQDALMRVIDNKDYREAATQRAYNKLKEGFTWEKTAEKLAELIK